MVISESDASVLLCTSAFEVNTWELIHDEEFYIVRHEYIGTGVRELIRLAHSV